MGADFDGAAAYIDPGSHADFINCTITNNGGNTPVGGVSADGTATLVNTIVYANSGMQLAGNIGASYSCIDMGWPGEGNISSDPLLVDPLGPDGIAGTEDDDLRLAAGSPCIDAGDNLALPADSFDLDGNGNTAEPLPVDFAGHLRLVNDPATPNTGSPAGAHVIVDMGAYEFATFRPIFADLNADGAVNVLDLLILIDSWGRCSPPCPADLDGNGIVNQHDLISLIQHWS